MVYFAAPLHVYHPPRSVGGDAGAMQCRYVTLHDILLKRLTATHAFTRHAVTPIPGRSVCNVCKKHQYINVLGSPTWASAGGGQGDESPPGI